MRTTLIAATAALLAAFAIPQSDAITISCTESGCNSTGGDWRSLSTGDAFWEKTAGGWDTLAPAGYGGDPSNGVTVIGSRWNWEDHVMWDYYNGNQLSPPINFDSRDLGDFYPDEKKQTPPNNKDQKACEDDCKRNQDLETAECDIRASAVEAGAAITAGLVWSRVRWGKILSDPIVEAGISGKTVLVDGSAVAGGYYLICKGWVASRYKNCMDKTCKP